MAKRKIVISEYDNIAALMEDDRAVEFIIHRGDMLLGDVYLATVENILPSIDAAFLNVGGDKMGFLHSSDVPGKGDLKERLEPKQQLVVQIMKEPTGHKGPRVSTNISLPGRFLVMMPESKGISISRKIVENSERSRLKSVVSLIKPPGVGVIIRTEALNQKDSDITEDFETLLERWQNIVSMADTASGPTLLYRDQDLLYRVIREAVTEDVTEIIVDSAFGQQRAQQLLQTWNMDKGIKVTHFQGSQSILVGTGVDKEIKLALQTKVPLPSGGYLYIQPTEALCVVDVNSGKFTSLQSQAETIKLTNLESCREIARQLRLRNVGGMIIVDFIDMESRANQLQVLQCFENELAPDKAKPQMGQLSDLGLVEMTRHRQGQSLSEIFTRRCPTCVGTGHAQEELTWMNSGGDSDSRSRQGGRPGGPSGGGPNAQQNRMPTTRPQPGNNRLQQVPKPAASVHQRRDKGRTQIGNLGDAAKREAQRHVPESETLVSNELHKPQSAPGNRPTPVSHSNDNGDALLELLGDRVSKKFGIHLAAAAKLSYLPAQTNSILSRIHPKANDIVSLVHSIESTGQGEPFNHHHFEDRDERDNGDGEEGEGDDDSDDDVQGEQVSQGSEAEQIAQEEIHNTEVLRHSNFEHEAPQTLDETLGSEPVSEVSSVSEAREADEPERVERPRRSRPPRRPAPQEENVEATEPENSSDSEENFQEASPAEAEQPAFSHSPFAENHSDDDEDGEHDDDDDDDTDSEESASSTPGGVPAKRRRGGRTAKRSIKKPPNKR
jgi:ribonuclease E